MRLFDKTSLPALERAMTLAAWKQRAHASNVANAGTPGYKRLEARFSDVLAATEGPQFEVEKTDEGHLDPGTTAPNPVQLHVAPAADGGPEVELDQEMVALAQVELTFDLEARVAGLRLAGIRASINGKR
jgi:flagellar basal-body rod protein FlgB